MTLRAVAICTGALFAGATAAASETCPNAGLRAGASSHLPACRAYEMATPVYKAGYWATLGYFSALGAAPSGEVYAFSSTGRFSGEPANTGQSYYVARRGSAGWTTTPISAPPAVGYTLLAGKEVDYSSTLESAAQLVGLGANSGVGAEERSRLAVELHGLGEPDDSAFYAPLGEPFETATPGKQVNAQLVGAAADLSHVVISVNDGSGGALSVGDTAKQQQLYDVSAGGAPAQPSLVGVDGEGAVLDPECSVNVGRGRHAVSASGSEIFFTTNVNTAAGKLCENAIASNPQELYVRVGDTKTLEISRPEGKLECGAGVAGVSEACTGANRASVAFEGASEDGSLVFFVASGALSSEDTNSKPDLYMVRIERHGTEAVASTPVQISHDPREGIEAADVQESIVAVSGDGSHVYYVAHGVLAGENAEHEPPASGGENLYLYDSRTATTTFVADLCSGPQLSGLVPDPRCGANLSNQQGYRVTIEAGERHNPVNDSELWIPEAYGGLGNSEAQVNECVKPDMTECVGAREPGRFLVFTTYAQLTPDDKDYARDVYRYDAQTGRIVRVSLGEDGYSSNGNEEFDLENVFLEAAGGKLETEGSGEFVANATIAPSHFGGGGGESAVFQYEQQTRAVTEDGSRIVFSTDEVLSPLAANARPDVYEWSADLAGQGRVGLISSGIASTEDTLPTISPSGRDVFFGTVVGLAPQDTGGDGDIYDARIGGGFPPQPVQPERCSGDACQGPLSSPAPLLVPASAVQPGGGNLVPAKVRSKGKVVRRGTKKSHTRRRSKRGRGHKTGRSNKGTGGKGRKHS